MVVNSDFLNHWYTFHKKICSFFSAASTENRYLRFSVVTPGPASRAVESLVSWRARKQLIG